MAAAQTRLRAPRRSTATVRTASARARTLAGSGPVDDVTDQRIYHVTHVRNLPHILDAGVLFADANPGWSERPVIDASSDDTRSVRRSTPVAGSGDATVAHFVPFYLSPNASLWLSIRSDVDDPRLSREALDADPADFVILVGTVKSLTDTDNDARPLPYVVADGDAGHVLTRFATTREDADRSLRRLRADQDGESPAIAQAELLVEESFPLSAVTLIGVAHDKARAGVRKILAESGTEFSPKVAVYPPWFATVD
jgi:hypothetical protein